MMNTFQTNEKVHTLKRVLLVEDDADLSLIATQHLQANQCLVDAAFSCAQALEWLQKHTYDLILLDEMLPDMNGSELCATIRAQCTCPIIFLSCCSDSDSIITALKNGGDDYMVKPINYKELMARAEAIARRFHEDAPEADHLRTFRSFAIDTIHRNIIREGTVINLTPIEYSLLEYLVDRPNVLLLYRELYEQVWSCDSLGDVRTISVHISNLRKKLDPHHAGLISTVRGVGYIFSDI